MVGRPFAFHCIHLENPGALLCLVNILAQSKKPTKVIKPFSIDKLRSRLFFYLFNAKYNFF